MFVFKNPSLVVGFKFLFNKIEINNIEGGGGQGDGGGQGGEGGGEGSWSMRLLHKYLWAAVYTDFI